MNNEDLHTLERSRLLCCVTLAVVLASYLALGAGQPKVCGEEETDRETAADVVESKTLRAELQKLVGELLDAARNAGEPVPEEWDAEKAAAFLIAELRKTDPAFLRVTAEVERTFAAGKFAPAEAKKRVDAAIRTFEEFELALPKMHEDLIEQHKAGQLSGVRLELTAELFEASVASLMKELE